MVIKGFQKISLIDYPGKIAAVVFAAGCNFRCPYCYNRELVFNPDSLKTIPEEDVFEYLKKRKGLIEGVVLSGGEPTMQKDLSRFIDKIKRSRLFVKLDTNGSKPDVVEELLKKRLLDYIALDVKAPLDERYEKISNFKFQISNIRDSISLLSKSGIEYELRTTVVPTLHIADDLVDLAKQLKTSFNQLPAFAPSSGRGVTSYQLPVWYLQQFEPKNCLDPEFVKIQPYDKRTLKGILKRVREYIPSAELRGV